MASFNKQDPIGTLPPPATLDPRLYPAQHCYIPPVNRRPTWVRFLHAFAAACVVGFLFKLFFRSSFYFGHYRPWPPGRHGRYPIPPHVTLERCVAYGDWSSPPAHNPWPAFPLSSTAKLDLPLSADTLLLLARGPMSAGSVEIVTSPQQDQDVATVEVVVGYFREHVRSDTKVCEILRQDGGIGVGIFTPERPPWHHDPESRLQFTTKIILPELSAESSPLVIKKFETDVPNTVHKVGDLNKKILFQSLILRGSNARIDVESLQADIGVIETSNSGIKGTFNTSESLSLITRNGPIDADIGLSSVDASEPNVSLITNNGGITSLISLMSDTNLGGTFRAVATTSNGRLDVDFPTAPLDSILTFSGSTSNARAAVSLNPAYEGSFFIQTSNSKSWVYQDESVIDPSGKNRKRSLRFTQLGHTTSGDVYWNDAADAKPAGVVSIRSSNAQVKLDL